MRGMGHLGFPPSFEFSNSRVKHLLGIRSKKPVGNLLTRVVVRHEFIGHKANGRDPFYGVMERREGYRAAVSKREVFRLERGEPTSGVVWFGVKDPVERGEPTIPHFQPLVGEIVGTVHAKLANTPDEKEKNKRPLQ